MKALTKLIGDFGSNNNNFEESSACQQLRTILGSLNEARIVHSSENLSKGEAREIQKVLLKLGKVKGVLLKV